MDELFRKQRTHFFVSSREKHILLIRMSLNSYQIEVEYELFWYHINLPVGSTWSEAETIICDTISLLSPLLLLAHEESSGGVPFFVSGEEGFKIVEANKIEKVYAIACKRGLPNEKNLALKQLLQRTTSQSSVQPSTIQKKKPSTSLEANQGAILLETSELPAFKTKEMKFSNNPFSGLRRCRSFDSYIKNKFLFETTPEYPTKNPSSLKKCSCHQERSNQLPSSAEKLRELASKLQQEKTSSTSIVATAFHIYRVILQFFYYLFNILLLFLIISAALTYFVDLSHDFHLFGLQYQAADLPFVARHYLKVFNYELSCLCILNIKICV